MTDPYNHDEEDDDPPTLQRVPSANVAAAPAIFDAFPDEATTATDLDVLGPIADARTFEDVDTEKMPMEVRANLVRASLADDGA